MLIHPDRLFPAEPAARDVARRLYADVRDLPIVSPHGHTDPRWYRGERAVLRIRRRCSSFPTTTSSACSTARACGSRISAFATKDGSTVERDPRAIWRRFAAHYHLFRGTPTRTWLDHTFATLFGFTERLSAANADAYYDRIDAALRTPEFRPRALFERFRIEAIATTESPLDPLKHHETIRQSGWNGRVVTAYRPDPVVDPDFEGFRREPRALRRDHRLRHRHLERLSGSASQAARLLPGLWRDLHRSRPPDGADGRSLAGRRRGSVPPRLHGRCEPGGCGAVPRPDADRDGGHERRGRHGHADPSRLVPQPQPGALPPLRPRHGRRYSARGPITCAPSSRCSTASATSRTSRSSSSPWTRRAIRASLRRSPGIIRR